jgi:hypothetical protein
MLPYGICTFCDDIRFEQQNKMSLIGCYGPELILYQTPPIALPKLCFYVQVRARPGRLQATKTLIYLPDEQEPFFTHEIKEEEHASNSPTDLDTTDDLEHQRGIILPFVFSPFLIAKTGFIRVRMLFGSERIRLGALKITCQVPSENTAV